MNFPGFCLAASLGRGQPDFSKPSSDGSSDFWKDVEFGRNGRCFEM